MISLVAVHVTRTIKLLLFFFKTLKSFKEMFFQSLIAFPIAEDVIVSFFFVVKDVLNRRIIIKTLIPGSNERLYVLKQTCSFYCHQALEAFAIKR